LILVILFVVKVLILIFQSARHSHSAKFLPNSQILYIGGIATFYEIEVFIDVHILKIFIYLFGLFVIVTDIFVWWIVHDMLRVILYGKRYKKIKYGF
jgi:hypothetical protein